MVRLERVRSDVLKSDEKHVLKRELRFETNR